MAEACGALVATAGVALADSVSLLLARSIREVSDWGTRAVQPALAAINRPPHTARAAAVVMALPIVDSHHLRVPFWHGFSVQALKFQWLLIND
jgi:hypothetical protein